MEATNETENKTDYHQSNPNIEEEADPKPVKII